MWFDKEKSADGIQALRYYRYEVDPNSGQFSRNPLHDAASNGSDALRYVAVAMQGPRRAQYPSTPLARRIYAPVRRGSTRWMGM